MSETQVTIPAKRGREPRVYVIILNWNGWRDTISCLESVRRLDYDNFCIVVCDNGSTDGSMDHILDWVNAEVSKDHNACQIALPKAVVDHGSAWRYRSASPNGELIFLQNESNLGFAGGNNAGLKFALARGDCDYIWLLNNDTVVETGSLAPLVDKMKSSGGMAICGSTLLCNGEPGTVQSRGASYNKWFARARLIGAFARANDPIDEDALARKMDFVVGASMFVSKRFLDEIGLISEDYFLYFEELDWTLRARGKYKCAYASRSVVYHKGGGTTGANTAKKSLTGEYYGTRARILFTRRFYPYALPTVLAAIAGAIFIQVLKGHFRNANAILAGALDGLRGRVGAREKFIGEPKK